MLAYTTLILRPHRRLPQIAVDAQKASGKLCASTLAQPIRATNSRTPQLPLAPKPHAHPKIQLVSDHTPAGRTVFYCVRRDNPAPKPPNYEIKNCIASKHQNSHIAPATPPIRHAEQYAFPADFLTPDTRHLTPNSPTLSLTPNSPILTDLLNIRVFENSNPRKE